MIFNALLMSLSCGGAVAYFLLVCKVHWQVALIAAVGPIVGVVVALATR